MQPTTLSDVRATDPGARRSRLPLQQPGLGSRLEDRPARTLRAALQSPVVVGLGVLLLGLALRLYGLGAQSLWGDEAVTLGIVTGRLDRLWSGEIVVDHLPGYFLMLAAVTRLFGDSEFVLRFPSALAGAMAAVGVWAIGRELGWRSGALMAAVLMALSPVAVFWGQQAKPEALAMAVAVWSSFLLLAAWRRRGIRWWVAYSLLNLAGLYIFYYHVFLLAAHSVVVLAWHVSRRNWRDALRWLALQGLLGAALAPALLLAVTRGLVDAVTNPRAPYTPVEYARLSAEALLASTPSSGALTIMVLSVMAAVVAIGCVLAWRSSLFSFGLAVIGAWLVVPLVAAYVLELVLRDYETRYLLMLIPAFSLILGFSLEQLLAARGPLRLAAIACGALVVLFWLHTNVDVYNNPIYAHGYREAAAYFLHNREDSGVILGLRGDYEMYAYDYYVHEPGHFVSTSAATISEQLRALNGQYKGVWFSSYTTSQRIDAIENPLEAVASPTDLVNEYRGVRMRYYRFAVTSASNTVTAAD